MSEQQPELRWAPLPPAPKRRGRAWLIAGLLAGVLVTAVVLLFFLIPRDPDPRPEATSSPTPSPSATPTATPSPSATPTPVPVVTSPPPVDPGIPAFRDQVSGWLDDAPYGLDIIAANSNQDALPVVDTLREDAQRLADAQAPSSISAQWRDGVAAYAQTLVDLRSALSSGSGTAEALDAARSSLQNVRSLVGL
ncbi:hypothetical protein MHM582_1133 [Microbacterium sp. HM58-2]|nr:hypothetical protein MHM582_1133 [Microbacterium sp. HM58-2]